MTEDMCAVPAEQLKAGIRVDIESGHQHCLFCGRMFENGEIFEIGGRYFDAAAAARHHVAQEHGGALSKLTSLPKQMTGLTDNQKALLLMMAGGMSDRDIAKTTGTSSATVRHQRFMFRERAKQAKLFLCIYELALGDWKRTGAGIEARNELAEIHGGAKMVDERYVITKSEEEEIVSNMFSSLTPLRLKNLSPKEKKKIVILRKISGEFEINRKYSEKEVNEILMDIYDDYATVRRYLIEYGFMDRTSDGQEYWLR